MEKTLFETTKHKIYFWIRACEYILWYSAFVTILLLFDYFLSFWNYLYIFIIVWLVVLTAAIYSYHQKFNKSKFVITNNRIYMTVQSGLRSNYEMSIYWSNVKDFAYTRNHILHKMLDYGNLRIRSWTNKESEFYASELPDIWNIYKILNYLYVHKDRANISFLPNNLNNKINNIDLQDSVLQKLLKVKWITNWIVLTQADREYIWNHEEERNHGVFECISKKYLICVLHDDNFRNPDADIVVTYHDKVIFPAVPFHEVELNSTISSSPSVLVHNYLCEKFDFYVPENYASILIWFDEV